MRTQIIGSALLTLGATTLAQSALPLDIENTIRKNYFMDGAELRYVDGAIDLNGDGKDEIIVYVVGGGACGTGGCPTLVFTPADSGYRLVSNISVTRVPIWAARTTHAGWRDLIVSTGGGGLPAGKTALAFNGKTYPENPTANIKGVRAGDSKGATLVVKQFASFDEAKPLGTPR